MAVSAPTARCVTAAGCAAAPGLGVTAVSSRPTSSGRPPPRPNAVCTSSTGRLCAPEALPPRPRLCSACSACRCSSESLACGARHAVIQPARPERLWCRGREAASARAPAGPAGSAAGRAARPAARAPAWRSSQRPGSPTPTAPASRKGWRAVAAIGPCEALTGAHQHLHLWIKRVPGSSARRHRVSSALQESLRVCVTPTSLAG